MTLSTTESVNKCIKLVVVEDDRDYSRVLIETICDNEGIELIHHFRNPLKFLSSIESTKFDVVLLDIKLPNMCGIDCIVHIKKYNPLSKIIMLTVHDDVDYILRAIRNGANGYLLKDSGPNEIVSSIHSAIRGEFPMANVAVKCMIDTVNGMQIRTNPLSTLQEILTQREFEVLKSLSGGRKYADVAKELEISTDTVKSHTKRIYEKLGVNNKTQAVAHYLKEFPDSII